MASLILTITSLGESPCEIFAEAMNMNKMDELTKGSGIV